MSPLIHKVVRPNLFWKIFLWFWLATLIILTSITFIYSLTAEEGKLLPSTLEESRNLRKTAIKVQLRHLIDDYVNAPVFQTHRLKEFLDNIYIIDTRGKEISGKDVPESVYHLRSYFKKKNASATIITNNLSFIGPEIVYNRGRHFQLYLTQKSRQHFSTVISHLYHSISFWHLLFALGISSLVCFSLAWYLTRPINQLQKATRSFAMGNLDTRATEFIGNRHDEFTDLADDFDQMADKVHQMIQSQKRLLSDVSHELRSPLTRMQIASGLALKNTQPENKDYLERIELEIGRLDDMIGELLQVAALERGSVFEQRSHFVINDLLEILVNDAAFEADANGKKVLLHATEDLPFYGYYGLLARSLENILRNAIRHTAENSQVELFLTLMENKISIKICDQGNGVSNEHLESIFKPFYRPTDARERTSGGAGLGLAIAQRGIIANRGTVSAANQDSGGLCVSILLPSDSQNAD